MKLQHGNMQYELPSDLRDKLLAFRGKLWANKTLEGIFLAVVLMISTYLLVFIGDRLTETPAWIRAALLLAGLAGWLVYLPWQVYQWVWQHRELNQLARLMAHDQPRIGDRLLGVIELVQTSGDGNASPGLIRAAIQQVAEDTRSMNFDASLPRPRHRYWGAWAGAAAVAALAALLVPAAGWNALQRWAMPLAGIQRYTFTQLADVPAAKVIPLGEPVTLSIPLADSTRWQPAAGKVRYDNQSPLKVELKDGQYEIQLPPQTEPGSLYVSIGDARHTIRMEPKNRPELTALTAHVKLPDYLGYSDLDRDARSGVLSLVKGSQASFLATASRDLAHATINGTADGVKVKGPAIESSQVEAEEQEAHVFSWQDVDGLTAKNPFRLRVRTVSDYPPTVQCGDLALEQVLLDEETLSFEVQARDDFGVRQVGVEWTGIEDPRRNPKPDKGEFLIAGGKQDATQLTSKGAFSPKQLNIEPQPILLRLYAEDYYPGRERAYSQYFRVYVLNRQQHMIWITEQLERWERQALEVRDEEARLLKVNEELQKLTPEELDRESTRRQLAQQAAAERANARKLTGLTTSGEKLVAEAARNTEFNVQTLEKWAQVLAALKGLAGRNMPSVASQLASAANASAGAAKPAGAPSVNDSVRPANRDPDKNGGGSSSQSPPSPPGGSLQLPTTTIMGKAGKSSGGGGGGSASHVNQAVEEQQELLAEFTRLMDELSKVLQDLKGSTFVKRLKAAADYELKMAAELHDELPESFGVARPEVTPDQQEMVKRLTVGQMDTSTDVSLIQEDLLAYFERTQKPQFQRVHEEMKQTEVVANLRSMSDAMNQNRSGESIGLAEYWADQMDRWAEILVGPGCPNCSPGACCKGDSLPPSIVLEVMRILKAEVDLRDNTRVVQQTRGVRQPVEHKTAASELETVQDQLVERTQLVIDALERMQVEQKKNYGKALAQLAAASKAMNDAGDLLAAAETGPATIAAETEAIESLLITKKIKPGSGGGSGETPGGGTGQGGAEDASALAGLGDELMTESRNVAQATGNTRMNIPEEFRSGMDAYFSTLEGRADGG